VAEFYRIVRVQPNGRESILRDIPIAGVTDSQAERAQAFVAASEGTTVGQHIRVYSSSGETVSPGDLIWDSDIDYGYG
jgi:hypothetical protein